MCVYTTTLWVLGPDGWHLLRTSKHKAMRWLELCESWDDVLTIAREIDFEPEPHP